MASKRGPLFNTQLTQLTAMKTAHTHTHTHREDKQANMLLKWQTRNRSWNHIQGERSHTGQLWVKHKDSVVMIQKLTTELELPSCIPLTYFAANVWFITEVAPKVFMSNRRKNHQLSNYGNEADVPMWNNRLVRSTMLTKANLRCYEEADFYRYKDPSLLNKKHILSQLQCDPENYKRREVLDMTPQEETVCFYPRLLRGQRKKSGGNYAYFCCRALLTKEQP